MASGRVGSWLRRIFASMDIAGLKALFGQRVLADAGKEFVGTLEPIAGSQVNGVTALSAGAITFIQKLS